MGEVVNVQAAPAQEAQILDAFDRPADEGVALMRMFHDA